MFGLLVYLPLMVGVVLNYAARKTRKTFSISLGLLVICIYAMLTIENIILSISVAVIIGIVSLIISGIGVSKC